MSVPVDVSAHVAQSAEHFLGKEEVSGSSPLMGSILVCCLFCCVVFDYELGGTVTWCRESPFRACRLGVGGPPVRPPSLGFCACEAG